MTRKLPRYEADDGPLSCEDIARIKEISKPLLPHGGIVGIRDLPIEKQYPLKDAQEWDASPVAGREVI